MDFIPPLSGLEIVSAPAEPLSERIQLVEDIWDMITEDLETIQLTDQQKAVENFFCMTLQNLCLQTNGHS